MDIALEKENIKFNRKAFKRRYPSDGLPDFVSEM